MLPTGLLKSEIYKDGLTENLIYLIFLILQQCRAKHCQASRHLTIILVMIDDNAHKELL